MDEQKQSIETISFQEFSKRAGISTKTLYLAIQQGRLKPVQNEIGKRVLPLSQLEEFKATIPDRYKKETMGQVRGLTLWCLK